MRKKLFNSRYESNSASENGTSAETSRAASDAQNVRSVAAEDADKFKVSKVDYNKLELLITVVNRQKGEFFADLIQSFEVNMQLLVRGEGTANAQMLSMLGLEDSAKTVIFSVIRQDKIADALAALKKRFKTIKNGKGIAYTVPLSSVIGVAIFGFLSNNKSTVKEG